MQVRRQQETGQWVLTRGSQVLYRGQVSPWESSSIMAMVARQMGRDVLEKGHRLQLAGRVGAGAGLHVRHLPALGKVVQEIDPAPPGEAST